MAVVEDVLDLVVAATGPLAADVVAAGISCFYHSIAGRDGAGRPITPIVSWADMTSAAAAAALRERIDGAEVLATTGASIHASYWPARIVRLRSESPSVRAWTSFSELLAEALTGRAVISRSMASGTGLLDRATGTWSAPLLAQLELDADRLPTLVGDEEAIGLLAGDASRRWPAFAHVTWFAAWGDGACGNVGLGAVEPGRAALMVGTSGALRTIVAEPAPAILPGLFAYRLGAGAVVGGQLSEGGGTLVWLSRLLRRSNRALERQAAALVPADHGLTVLPYVFGERGLGYHDDARGALVGLTADSDAGDVYRAVIESIAFDFAALDERLSVMLGGAPAIVASGGALARSPLLGQVLADSLGRDIGVASTVESSRRGAALLALGASGHLDHSGAVAPPPMRTIASDPARSARYRAARARQDHLYRLVVA